MHNLRDLYVRQLRDIYDAEKQIAQALPKMAGAASDEKLKQAFQQHLKQTRHQIERLDQIFEMLDETPHGESCEAMQGLIKEGEQVIAKEGDARVKDAALITAAQRVEHYEIAAYGTVCAYARQLKETQALDLLEETLSEEKETDSDLNGMAVHSINHKAAMA